MAYDVLQKPSLYFLRLLACVCLASHLLPSSHASFVRSYQAETRLFKDKLGPDSGYDSVVRPKRNQIEPIQVNVSFEIVAILEVDAINQRFVVNGFVGFEWLDELLQWNMSDYEYTFMIHPNPQQVWRPRTVLANTVVDRDLFKDDYSPILAYHFGVITWYPGSLFPTSCKLNMYRFPFDVQHCYIQLLANGYSGWELHFVVAKATVGTQYFVESGEWKIERSYIEAESSREELSYFKVHFVLRRLPSFFVINIITPIVLMSFLNILVFLIPEDSGEKISYGITVLLALSVFMSIVSDQLPRTSDTIPLVNIYLLVLTSLSVATVVVSIITVSIHHRQEKEDTHQRAMANFKTGFHKVDAMNRGVAAFNQVAPHDTRQRTARPDASRSERTEKVLNVFDALSGRSRSMCSSEVYQREATGDDVTVNKWKRVGKHLNAVSFVVFLLVWVSVTVAFLVEMAR